MIHRDFLSPVPAGWTVRNHWNAERSDGVAVMGLQAGKFFIMTVRKRGEPRMPSKEAYVTLEVAIHAANELHPSSLAARPRKEAAE